MDELKKRWYRYHYKNITYFCISIAISLFLLTNPSFKYILLHIGKAGYIGAFFAGMLFASTFTITIGGVILLFLAETLLPYEIGLLAGLGSVFADSIIFNLIRSKSLVDEIKYFFQYFGGNNIKHLIHSKYFSWTLPVIGAILIASPLPDELGVGLMGISKLKTYQFLILSFVLNTTGIILFVSAGYILRP